MNSLIVSIIIIVVLIGAIAYSVGTSIGRPSTTTVTTTTTQTISMTATTATTSTETSTTTETTTSIVVTSGVNASEETQLACTYLASNYNASVGLISETPSQTRYWLYSDNYLATLVLPKNCDNPSLAESISKTLSQHNTSKIPNQFMVFDCKQYFQGSKDYNLADDIWTTVNNQPGAPLDDSYADVAFLQAYYDAKCTHNVAVALAVFGTGAREYDGVGFNDVSFRAGQSEGIYQTYKVALYSYTAGLLNQTVPLSALVNLARMQAKSGGFYTGYDVSLSNDGTLTNTETTCLAIMALEAASPATPTISVGAVLYLWYGYGSTGSGSHNSSGWNVTGSTSAGGFAVVDKPVKGYYASDDKSTFGWQVQQMEKTGLSFAVVSWWGNASSGRNGTVNKATLDLFKCLKEINSDFRIAVMVDAYNQTNGATHNLSNSTLKADYDYVFSSFVEPFGNWYFDWQGKPLLLFFSPNVPTYNDSRFTVRTIGNLNCRPIDSCQEPDWIWWTAPIQFY